MRVKKVDFPEGAKEAARYVIQIDRDGAVTVYINRHFLESAEKES